VEEMAHRIEGNALGVVGMHTEWRMSHIESRHRTSSCAKDLTSRRNDLSRRRMIHRVGRMVQRVAEISRRGAEISHRVVQTAHRVEQIAYRVEQIAYRSSKSLIESSTSHVRGCFSHVRFRAHFSCSEARVRRATGDVRRLTHLVSKPECHSSERFADSWADDWGTLAPVHATRGGANRFGAHSNGITGRLNGISASNFATSAARSASLLATTQRE
jgi:hypothetical protein